MKAATKVLPHTYTLHRHIDETKYKKAVWVVILIGGLVFWISFILFNRLAGILRPEYPIVEQLQFRMSTERLIALLHILLPVAFVLLLHECIHAVLLWLYTKERPALIVTLKGIGGIAVRMPSWYLSRDAFLTVNLAPVSLMTLAVPFLILILPRAAIGTLVFCAALNLAGSLSDIVSSIYIFSFPATIYLNTNGQLYCDKDLSNVKGWKRWLQSSIDWFLAKLQ
jgi:hypothetical protein